MVSFYYDGSGGEAFLSNAILLIPIVATFLIIYIYNRDKRPQDAKSFNIYPVFADASLIGIFLTLMYGLRVQQRAFSISDPAGALDGITSGFYQVIFWLMVILSIVLFIRVFLNILDLFRQKNEGSYGRN